MTQLSKPAEAEASNKEDLARKSPKKNPEHVLNNNAFRRL